MRSLDVIDLPELLGLKGQASRMKPSWQRLFQFFLVWCHAIFVHILAWTHLKDASYTSLAIQKVFYSFKQVKSVFVDGMPAEWDDQKLKEHFGKHGDIVRIVLAKNIPRSKRRDFAFINFATRDAAVAAIEALNDVELADGDKEVGSLQLVHVRDRFGRLHQSVFDASFAIVQVKLKVELAKPAPRKKRIRGHRGSYPVGGHPSKSKKSKGDAY